jgi:hypothetical protein
MRNFEHGGLIVADFLLTNRFLSTNTATTERTWHPYVLAILSTERAEFGIEESNAQNAILRTKIDQPHDLKMATGTSEVHQSMM